MPPPTSRRLSTPGRWFPSINVWRPVELVGYVGTVSRGPEEGPEVHFEIFTTEKLTGELRHAFHYINATDDGAIARRADPITPEDANGDRELDASEVERFFRAVTSIAGRRSGAYPFVTDMSGETGTPRRALSSFESYRLCRRRSAVDCIESPSHPTSFGPMSSSQCAWPPGESDHLFIQCAHVPLRVERANKPHRNADRAWQ